MRKDQPTVAGRGLGAELRSIREERRFSTHKTADLLGWPQSKISKLETGKQGITSTDVASLLVVYGVTGHTRDQLLAKAERTEEPGLIESLPGLSRESRTLVELERLATLIFNFEPLLIPGMLQTPDYTRAVMTAARGSAQDIEDRVATRMARQATITRSHPPLLDFIIDEGALRRQILHPRLMARQLLHITEAAERQHVEVRILPWTAGAQGGLDGAFGIIDFARTKSAVFFEHKFTGTFLEEPHEIDQYRGEANRLKEVSLSPEKSIELVTSQAKDLEEQ